MGKVILCRITNTSSDKTISMNYQRASDEMWQYQVLLSPGQSRNIWYLENTLEFFPSESINNVSQCILFPPPIPSRPPIQPSVTPSKTPIPTPTITPTNSVTPSISQTNFTTPTPTNTPTGTQGSTPNPTSTPTNTPTGTQGSTPNPTSTPTNTPTGTQGSTPNPTSTPTNTPTNTPSATNVPELCIDGAGSPEVNGTYVYVGQLNGKNYYQSPYEDKSIAWSILGSLWSIGFNGTTYYVGEEDVLTPDLVTTWTTSAGLNPVPNVSSGICPTPTPTNTPTNTVTPTVTPQFSICLSGSNAPNINGTYSYSGKVNGKNSYINGDWFVKWLPGYWTIGDSGAESYFYSFETVDTPDLVTSWVINNFQGYLPPTVTAGSC